jgi:hypothetical protein
LQHVPMMDDSGLAPVCTADATSLLIFASN